MRYKFVGSYPAPEKQALWLADWALKTISFEDRLDETGAVRYTAIEKMADEVACQMPSPGECELLNIPLEAKILRRTLCGDISQAQTTEEAREVMFTWVCSLRTTG